MSIFPSDEWFHANSEDESGRTLLRVRASSPSIADQAVFGMLVVVTWLYDPDDSGLPKSTDREQMDDFEAAVLAGTEQRGLGFLTSSLTGDGQKEWRYYAVNAEDFIRSLNADLDQHPDYPLRIGYYNDSKWIGLHELQALVKSDALYLADSNEKR
jgi:hypothetical protein